MIALNEMGERISIIGCSNSGKSTLANSLSRKLNTPAYHLDQIAHIENTKWVRNSDEVLIEQHHKIIMKDAWIIDGNYSVCMKERLDIVTGVIWLDPNVFSSVYRYIYRCFKNDKNRPGKLVGVKNDFNFSLVKWILFNYPKNRKKYQKMLEAMTSIPVLHIHSMKQLKKYYAVWDLKN